MNRTRGLLLLLWAAVAAPSCFGEDAKPGASGLAAQTNPALVSQDPLMQQIRRRQLTQPNGGVTAVVRIGSGQVLELKLVDLDVPPVSGLKDCPNSSTASTNPLGGLSPRPGLIPQDSKSSRSRKRRAVKKASEQLKALEQQGAKQNWGESSRSLEEASRRRRY